MARRGPGGHGGGPRRGFRGGRAGAAPASAQEHRRRFERGIGGQEVQGGRCVCQERRGGRHGVQGGARGQGGDERYAAGGVGEADGARRSGGAEQRRGHHVLWHGRSGHCRPRRCSVGREGGDGVLRPRGPRTGHGQRNTGDGAASQPSSDEPARHGECPRQGQPRQNGDDISRRCPRRTHTFCICVWECYYRQYAAAAARQERRRKQCGGAPGQTRRRSHGSCRPGAG
mmetsp:Transcript_19633/g.48587  ORF Transcript_19633/g.48587 Transcript_19633/m.48587 type:complete len:229 (-) Transcript_19633:1073-1759(-)